MVKNNCIYCDNTNFRLFIDFGSSTIYRCTNCGLGKRRPFHFDATYGDDFVPRVERLHTRNVIHNIIFNRIEKFIIPGRMIDIGCSEGIPLVVAKKRGWRVDGIELSEKVV